MGALLIVRICFENNRLRQSKSKWVYFLGAFALHKTISKFWAKAELPRWFCVVGMLMFFTVSAAKAENLEMMDITIHCKFQVSSQMRTESNLFDSDAKTYWKSDKQAENYIQFIKPSGVATLNVLWQNIPNRILLEWREDGKSIVFAYYDAVNAEGEETSLPESIVLPEYAGVYRLTTVGEEMAVAELRIHEGISEGFFTSHGYPDSPVFLESGAPYMKPIRRNARVSQKVRQMQLRLEELGYFEGKADGKIGNGTYIALLRFQHANGLYPSGAYEPATAYMLENPQAISQQAASVPAEKQPRSASSFIAYLNAHVGDGYLYGGDGQISSPTVRGAAIRLFPEYTSLIKGYARRWDGMQVFDCSGLILAYLENSSGMFPQSWRGVVNDAVRHWATKIEPIETMPHQPGMLLLQENPTMPGSFVHVGVYVGNGLCVHSRGHRYGVITEPMPQLWTHWARPIWWLDFDIPEEVKIPWPEYMGPGERVIVDSADGNAIYLYSQPIKSIKYRMPVQMPNYSEFRIQSIPEEHYWRIATVPDSSGEPVTGYVYARDLSLIR